MARYYTPIKWLGLRKAIAVEVREKWRNISQNAKKTISGLKKLRRKTGRGPVAKPADATTEKVINLFHDEPSSRGFKGVLTLENLNVPVSWLCALRYKFTAKIAITAINIVF